jgi:hypothetical protein
MGRQCQVYTAEWDEPMPQACANCGLPLRDMYACEVYGDDVECDGQCTQCALVVDPCDDCEYQ